MSLTLKKLYQEVRTYAALIIVICLLQACSKEDQPQLPNIIIVLIDDLGYGDVSCNNPESKIQTTNIDRLAAEGIRFLDAHASASQCSPTRYGLLTGRYSWKTRLQIGVLTHFEKPLIDKDRVTIASLLKEKGYATAGIGKWHLGLGWQAKEGDTTTFKRTWDESVQYSVDFTKPLTDSPLDHGFDYYFGIANSNNMLPYCFIENNEIVQAPAKIKWPVFDTEAENSLVSEDYRSENIDQLLYSKALGWLNTQITNKPGKPFFLYFPTSAIHRPCLPEDDFIGQSEAGLRGDKTVEIDNLVGKLMNWLETNNLDKNTLFILTSDNGGRPGDPKNAIKILNENSYGEKYHPMRMLSLVDSARETENPPGARGYYTYNHQSNGQYRGYKFDVTEGGHRVPFIVRWPEKFKGGVVSNDLISTLDIFATISSVVGYAIPDNAGEDSHSIIPIISGEEGRRKDQVHKGWNANKFAIRQENWKFIPADEEMSINKEFSNKAELYNLDEDPGEQNNLLEERPDKAKELQALLDQYLAQRFDSKKTGN